MLSPAIFSPSLPARYDAPRYTESPFTASKMCPMSEPDTVFSNTIGTFAVLTLRAPSRRSVRFAATSPTCSGVSSFFSVIATEYQ